MNKIKILSVIILILLNASLVSSFVIHSKMYEGETKTYKTDEKTYEVELIVVSDTSQTARFKINDEITDGLGEDNSYKFSDGSEIHIMWIWTDEAGETKDSVEFYFYGKGTKPVVVEETEKIKEEKVILPIENKTIEIEEEITEEPEEETISEPEEKIVEEEKKSIFSLIIIFFKKLFRIK